MSISDSATSSSTLIQNINKHLENPYPAVYSVSNILPFDDHGWFNHKEVFENLIQKKKDIKIALEVGSWLGSSARCIAKLIPEDAILIAIDHWRGSIEHLNGQYAMLSCLFEQFISNTIHSNLTHKIIPYRSDSISAAQQLADVNIRADFIYIDASHDYTSVLEDLKAYYPLLSETGIFIGDDWHWESVAMAVQDFAKLKNLEIYLYDTGCWELRKAVTT